MRPDDYVEILNLYYFCNSTSLTKLSHSALPAWCSLCNGGTTPYAPRPSANSRFIFVAWGKEPHHALQQPRNTVLQGAIQALRPSNVPTYMVGNQWTILHITQTPLSYPRHPGGFFNYPNGRQAGLLRDIAIQLAPHLK